MPTIWRPNLAEIPEGPGVYSFRDAQGAILYIGKALNLRRRLASYGQRRTRQPAKLRRMLARARGVTIEETGSELEALLLESRLLKRDPPPFNRLSTRYAALPFVKLTLTEPFPRLVLTRQFAADGDLYLGPFPRHEVAEVVLTALQRLFPLRTCEGPIRPGVAPSPCAAFHVQKCAAPCVGPPLAAVYQRHIAEMLALLARGREAIVQRLLGERQRAVEALMFERARHLHALLTAFDEATLGRPLALMPVAQRHMAVLFARPPAPRQEVFLIRAGRFAGRLVLEGGPHERAWLRSMSASGDERRHSAQAASAEAVVDELRIVAGWLQRTRSQARWVPLAPHMSHAEAIEAALRALASPPTAAV
jgi:excinuclease UvrABC nuclease subunit